MIYAIADLHLSLSGDKPMDVFGERWHNYVARIEENWQNIVTKEDTVVIPGDISWAMKLEDALEDFAFIERLNGRKIIFKGNHDYFWETNRKLSDFFDKHGFTSMQTMKNTAVIAEDLALCGTKGFCYDTDLTKAQNEKLLNRETMRLEASLMDAEKQGNFEKVVFLHYPPVFQNGSVRPIIEVLQKHGVKRCYYGHLHSSSISSAVTGEYEGIVFQLISADSLDFKPIRIK